MTSERWLHYAIVRLLAVAACCIAAAVVKKTPLIAIIQFNDKWCMVIIIPEVSNERLIAASSMHEYPDAAVTQIDSQPWRWGSAGCYCQQALGTCGWTACSWGIRAGGLYEKNSNLNNIDVYLVTDNKLKLTNEVLLQKIIISIPVNGNRRNVNKMFIE